MRLFKNSKSTKNVCTVQLLCSVLVKVQLNVLNTLTVSLRDEI